MRPRIEVLLSLALLIILGVVAGSIGARGNRLPSFDPRRSSLLTGPNGAKVFAQALARLDVKVERYRQRTAMLPRLKPDARRPVLALLDPSHTLDGVQAGHLVDFFDTRGDLLLSGDSASPVMRCFGFDVDFRGHDSTPVFRVVNGVAEVEPVSWTSDEILAQVLDTIVIDSSDLTAGVAAECAVRQPAVVDTLMVTAGGRVAAVRLSYDSVPGRVTLVADGRLFSNARMRDTDAGLATLPLVGGRYRRVIFDEYEHGFGPSGSLLDATLEWSRNSPYGWVFWQLAIVGLVALLASAIRLGAPRSVIERRRRSPMEHVRALATALAAAKGSRVAVDLMIRGLRRRLSSGGQPTRGEVGPWLESLAANVRSTRSREAVSTLVNLTRRAPDSDSVLRAANAVEDVWQDLKPPSPTR